MKQALLFKTAICILSLFAMLLLCFITSFTHAQSRKIDSLNQLIAKERTDTGRVKLTNRKNKLISNENIDSGIFYGLRNLAEAKRISYYDGEIQARHALVVNYCHKGDFAAAAQELKQLEQLIKPSKDSVEFAKVFANYGMMYGMQSKYDTSIMFYKKAVTLAEGNKDSSELGSNYSNLSVGYQQQGNFATALFYQQKALKVAEKQGNETSQAYTLLNMGITYEKIGDSAKAKAAYLNSVAIASKLNLLLVEMYAHANLAAFHIHQKKWQEGYGYAIKSAEEAKRMGDAGMEATNLSRAALSLGYLGSFTKANQLAKHAILISDSSNQPLNISQAQESMAKLLFLQKMYKEAIPYFEKSFSVLGNTAIYDENTSDTYKELSACYENTGDYVKALRNYKMAIEIGDSVSQKENIRKATELSMNYDFEKKQEVLAAEKKKEDEIARTKQLALLAGLLFVLLLGVVAFIGYKNKLKANSILLTQKKQIEITLAELKATQAQLVQSEKMASLGELTAGIAHEIQNPLNFVNNFSEISKELIDEMKEELSNGNDEDVHAIADDVKANLEKIHHHGKRADAIVKGMLQHSGKSSGEKKPTDINALCNEYVKLAYHGIRAKDKYFNVDIKTELDKTIGSVNIVPQDIGRVLLNLFNNAFYAVNEKARLLDKSYQPMVEVKTRKAYDKVIITVSDNGNGISSNIIDKIFQPFFTTKPTGQGTGLGLSLSYDIVKANGGDIQVESKEGEGTTFTIQL